MKVHLFVTGGTFDKEYNELRGELFFKDTHVFEMLKLGRCTLDIRVETLMMIDSLEMQDSHRQLILKKCKNELTSRIVITHGTDTMVDTASYLDKHIRDKVIVFTGAMVPYKFGSSDGLFNLGSALAFVQKLPAGVYIAMNGNCLPCSKTVKNKKTGQFEIIN